MQKFNWVGFTTVTLAVMFLSHVGHSQFGKARKENPYKVASRLDVTRCSHARKYCVHCENCSTHNAQ